MTSYFHIPKLLIKYRLPRVLWLLLMVIPMEVFSQEAPRPVLALSPDSTYQNIREYLFTLPDPSGSWQLIDAEHAFKKEQAFEIKSLPPDSQVYWGKINIEAQQEQKSIISVGQAQNIILWMVSSDGEVLNKACSGTWVPLHQRSVKSTRIPAILLEFPSAGSYEIFVRWDFKKPQIMHKLIPRIYPANQWHKDNSRLKVLQGMFQGVMLIFFIYNLAKFFTSRDKAFLYYSLFVLFFDGYNLFFYGLGLEYLYPNFPRVDDYVWLCSTHLASIFYILFIKWFCNLAENYPSLWKWVQVYLRIKYVQLATVLFLNIFYADYALLDIIQRLSFLIEEILFVIFMVFLWRKGNPLYRYLVVGTVLFAITIGCSAVAPFLVNWNPYHYPLIMQVGAICKVFVFSMGLGYRLKIKEVERLQLQEDLILQLKKNKKLQAEINQTLESEVQARTRELREKNDEVLQQHRNIEAQNRQLTLLNEEQANLMKIVAHDLKSPLNRIEGMMSVFKLTMGDQAAKYDDYFNIISQSIISQKALISRVLSSENAKGVSIHIEDLNLSQMISSLVRLFGPIAAEKQVEVTLELPSKDVIFPTDDTLINAIIDNLISNAVKFSPPATQVIVKLQDSPASIQITVQDEGPGFTEEDQAKIFMRYQKLSAKPTGNEDSTGLGLSIVKQYTEVLGGEIKYITEVNKGTSFILNFPKER